MQRYFVKEIKDKVCFLNERDSYHTKTVMRSNINTKLEIVCNKHLYLGKITKLSDLVEVKIMKELSDIDNCYNVTIAQALVIENKMNLILQKTTELNVSNIIPLITDRSIIKVNKDFDKKIIRWQKIVNDAASQSKRLDIPDVFNVTKINELIKMDFDYKFLCTVNEQSKTIKNVLQKVTSYDRILFVIGPEGGFTEKEEKIFSDNGFISISLGNTVLRTETAPIAILSMLNYHFMR